MTTQVRCRECDAVAPPSAGWCGACGAALDRRATAPRGGALPRKRPVPTTPGRSVLWLALASVVLAAVAVVAVASGRIDGASLDVPEPVPSAAADRRGAPTVTTVSGAPLDEPTWHLPAPGPVDENATPAVVWTGDRMFVWGGMSRLNAPSSEGALYDPATDTWERIAPVPHPVGGRLDGVAEWTGAEVFVWGYGGEGRAALYDPREDEWRHAAPAPVPGRFSPTSVWTGTEVVAFGGENPNLGDDELRDGAAYDPQTDTWRSIPDVPLEGTTHMQAVWTGDLVIAVGGGEAASYDPTMDAWRPMPEMPTRSLHDPSVVWTGSEVVVWGPVADSGATENEAAAYEPAKGTWRSLPSPPLESPPPCECNGGQAAVWAGDRIVAWSGTLDAAGPVALSFDPTNDTWERIGVAPIPAAFGASLVWTGAEAIVWTGGGLLGATIGERSDAGEPIPFHGGGALLRLRDGRETGALQALGDEPTGARVFLTYPILTSLEEGTVRIIDVDARRERRLEVPEVSPGDALFRLEPVAGRLVFWGGDITYALDPDDGRVSELGRALQFVPAAEAGRVWLLGGTWEAPTIRQVELEGNVTVPEVPMSGGLAGAVDGAVIREGVVDVWDPVTDEVIADLGPAWVIATHGSRVAACTPPACRAVRIRDVATGDQTVVEPDATLREFHGSRGRFSPDGRRLAVGVVTVEGSMVALLDDAGGIDPVGPYGGGGVGWSPTGVLVFRMPDGRLGVHLPSGLRVVPIDLGESFGFAVGGA
ncbi:MAG: hypothetical protein KY469_17960 [Actinobacteria bacterium]|nr:hypothetical protein [Actinomycetota bacterium]